jgi:hypothetical protein
MTERMEQQYSIKFCQKLGDSKAETIRRFSRLSVMMQWVLRKSKSGLTASKMAAHWRTLTNVPGGHQQARMQMSLRI